MFIVEQVEDLLAALFDCVIPGDRVGPVRPRAQRLECLEGLLVIVTREVIALVVHVEQLEAGARAIQQAHLALPVPDILVDMLDEGAERCDARTETDQQQIR